MALMISIKQLFYKNGDANHGCFSTLIFKGKLKQSSLPQTAAH